MTVTEAPPTTGLRFRTRKFAMHALLEKASSVVPTKDLLPVLKNFQVCVTEGRIRVTATDLELSVIATSELVEVGSEGMAVFPAKKLLDIVKEAEEGDLTIGVQGSTAQIEVGRTQWTLQLMDGSEYPEFPDLAEVAWVEISRIKLLSAIRAVRYAAATETVRPSLMVLDVTDGEMRASDGVRFQQIHVGGEIPDLQIPITAVDDLVKILHSTEAPNIELGNEDNSLIFRVPPGDVFVAQKLNASFPDVNDLLLKPALANDQQLKVDRGELASAIKRVRITADPETSAVVLHLEKDQMVVASRDKYGCTCEEHLDVKWSGAKRSVAFNHMHLSDMLAMADVVTCDFWLGKDTKTKPSPLLLKDEESGMLGILNQIRTDWLS